ncbi:hypothetical protein AB1484_26500 [Parafrankia sp. FMc6]|uniref:hypothetical protein n=1 Tax=Parafrankia soli TaxID=2599596 RepID=UPI0034D640B6
MIIGSLVGRENLGDLETSQLDEILQVALDEIASNPIIDEQIRKNPVIMRELAAVVEDVHAGRRGSASA